MSTMIKSGNIHYSEDIIEEIDNAPKAFIGMMRGDNIGKRLVKVSFDPTL